MTWLARLSLANRALVALASVLILGFGVFATTSLRQELVPSMEIPVAAVVAPYPGATPQVVEDQVTEPLETAATGVRGVVGTSATSSGGMSVITVELEFGTDLGGAQQDLAQAVNRVANGLPDEVQPTVITGSVDDLPVLQLSAAAEADEQDTAAVLRDDVVPLLEGVSGVREVSLTGVADHVVTVDLDPAALAAHGIALPSVLQALQGAGAGVPAGALTQNGETLSVSVGAPVDTVEDLREVRLPAQEGGAVRLGDVAEVTSAPAEATGYSRTDGLPSIGIGVTKTPEGNTVEISEEVRALLPEIERLLGESGQVSVVFDQAPFIEQSIHDLTVEGMLGLVFAIVIILLFLLSLRSTLVTAVSIPLSVLMALISLYVTDYSLNILTLGALTAAVGRVVDDSIVVIENIKRHLGYGEPKRQAIITAVREVAGAITSSTITTVAVFLPIALVGGQVGELFRPFAVTVSVALTASLLVSLTIVPVLAYWFLKDRREAGEGEPDAAAIREKEERAPLQRTYLPVLRGALAHPVITLVVAVGVLGGTFALIPRLQTNFLGDSGQNTLSISQELPPGASLETADAAARQVEDVLADTDAVEEYQASIGTQGGMAASFGMGGSSGTTTFSVTTDEEADQTAVQAELRERLAELSDAGEITVDSGGMGFGGASGLEVIVSGDDEADLADTATRVTELVADTPGATDVSNNLAVEAPSIEVTVDREAAAAIGMDEAAVGQLVAGAMRGTPAGSLTLDGTRQDIVVRSGAAPADIEALREFPLGGGPAGAITLGDIATVEEVSAATSITRQDGQRSATVSASLAAEDLGSVNSELRTRIDGLDVPPGIEVTIGGVSADQDEAFADLGLALLLAVAIVYVVMVATFRSLLQPLLLLVSVPFAATGALGLLVLTGTPLGVPALIGMLMLIGIVVTNAIVLIDLVNQVRRSGRSIVESIIEGSRQRLRPILMTALATICALVPMSLGITGGGVFISQPLAIVVIGGLFSSTLLTLVLVPVLYSLTERARAAIAGRSRGRRHAEDEVGSPATD
ncbi:HAE1 family hydrophobic/amphiphilic exporter-1 [Actinoalloteichus hoggarensis]|uniref:Swarming motility protein SwrC n=1 Tax=Actinoalloteichus hoggarensis TaxID=1470176 RepID=A0A221W645_9PSEU|nr:efflux RND transporter permease subunit [Actinoalloteichus hoggarensis]ASO21338.1 Swarming motility protein SwrC [Actinoalloteichus hoggarensis]MBB5921271.1 HAE1 family hydrophobic/amphiphilic exporter-1 [Actinoalloteichus hoggarensis]